MNNFEWILHQQEGQFFERKSCFDRSQGKVRRRPVRDVAWDVAETLAAMVNADGGALVLGIEDDGAVSGADYPEDRLKILRSAPKTHIKPAVKARIREGNLHGKPVLLFEVAWSMEAHQLADGRYLLRIDDKNLPFPAADIEAMKEGKRRRVTETRFVKIRPPSGNDHPEQTEIKYCIYDKRHNDYGYTEEWVKFLITKFKDEKAYEELFTKAGVP